jgi:hypothetical protein
VLASKLSTGIGAFRQTCIRPPNCKKRYRIFTAERGVGTTFFRVFGKNDWAVMFIIAQNGQSYPPWFTTAMRGRTGKGSACSRLIWQSRSGQRQPGFYCQDACFF